MTKDNNFNYDTLFLGTKAFPSKGNNCSFFTNLSFHDYDTVVIFPEGCLKSSSYDYTHFINFGVGTLDLPSAESNKFLNSFSNTIEQIERFLKSGKTIFIIGQKLPLVRFENDNFMIIVHDKGKEIGLPELSKITEHKGKKIEFTDHELFSEFWKITDGIWTYNASYQIDENETQLAHIKDAANQTVASYKDLDNGGRIITIPNFFPLRENVKKLCLGIDALLSKKEHKTTVDKDLNLPIWVEQYKIHNEKSTESKLNDLLQEKSIIEKKIKEANDLLAATIKYKSLLTENGKPLEDIVSQTMKDIGFIPLENNDKKRVDFIFQHKDKIFALEITGTNNKVKEKHARKLNTWVAETCEKMDTDEVKGILIVNPFKDKLLAERQLENSWPDKALEICQRHGFCAITTTQLLGLWTDYKNNSNTTDEIVEKLLNTNGEYPDHKDVKKFIDFPSQ